MGKGRCQFLVIRMYIKRLNDVDGPIDQKKYALAFFATGYESRARSIVESYPGISIEDKVCFAFSEYKEFEVRKINDRCFDDNFWKSYEFSGSNFSGVYDFVFSKLEKLKLDSTILVDISCMTRVWVAALVRAIFDCEVLNLSVVFCYNPALYKEIDAEHPPNEVLGPLPGFSSLNSPDKPSSLLIGLGQQPGRAMGLAEYIDASNVLLFCPLPGVDERYDQDLVVNNKDIINRYADGDYYSYPLVRVRESFKIIESVVVGIRRDSSLVLSSLGPKIFNLYCLLLSAHYRDVSVWRVSAGAYEKPCDRSSSGPLICVEVDFVSAN